MSHASRDHWKSHTINLALLRRFFGRLPVKELLRVLGVLVKVLANKV